MKLAASLGLDQLFLKKESSEAEKFTRIFNTYQKLVRSVIFQIAGDQFLNDLSQEAFVRIWKGFPKFRNEAEVTSWIYRISVNVALDSLRAKKRRLEEFDYDFSTHVSGDASVEDGLAQRQLVTLGLNSLSDDHKTVVVLALIHELPLAEIAEILLISEGTVKSRLHYAKEQLRYYINEVTQNMSLKTENGRAAASGLKEIYES